MEFKCSICLDKLFSANTDVSVPQCGHMYHKDCLESYMKIKNNCPNCRSEITSIVKTVYPDVYNELSYSSFSNEAKDILEEIIDYQKEKKIIMIDLIKKLDKENTSLIETNKSYQENFKTANVFLKSFEKENEDLQEKSEELKLSNNTLLAVIKNFCNDKENVTLCENMSIDSEEKLEHNFCNENCLSTTISNSEGLFSLIVYIIITQCFLFYLILFNFYTLNVVNDYCEYYFTSVI